MLLTPPVEAQALWPPLPFRVWAHPRAEGVKALVIRLAQPLQRFRFVPAHSGTAGTAGKRGFGGRCRIRTYDFHRVRMALYR